AYSLGEWVDASAGSTRYTNKQLDLALEGAGFFTVQTAGGRAVTRDGRFRVGPDKGVVDFSGNALLAEDRGKIGPLKFPDDAKWDAKIQVDEDGTCFVDGEKIGKLVLEDYPGYRGLQAAGGSLYFPTGAVKPQPAPTRVIQYALEDANTSALKEMTRTIEITRAFEAYQKTIVTVMDEVTAQAVRMGRVG
ncbi:MAG: flagellar hook basal-body protein, partial [Proteobacteria bacterium]|nr:flagellar hook basal-body protein [Pseudomonadota bacterium]